MVCFHSSISFVERVHMAKAVNSTDPYLKLRQINQLHRNKKAPISPNQVPSCERSRWAVVDLIIFISVIGACWFLLYPTTRLIMAKIVELAGSFICLAREEFFRAPMIYIFLGLSILCAATAFLATTICLGGKCGRPGCPGLRKAAEFDIQLETEECVKNSSCPTREGVKKGLFKLPLDHHRELEAELKKMAPPNGRAVLMFRGRCGCSVGRMEVPGPKKNRKVKRYS